MFPGIGRLANSGFFVAGRPFFMQGQKFETPDGIIPVAGTYLLARRKALDKLPAEMHHPCPAMESGRKSETMKLK
jgi:hypothetical protein